MLDLSIHTRRRDIYIYSLAEMEVGKKEKEIVLLGRRERERENLTNFQ